MVPRYAITDGTVQLSAGEGDPQADELVSHCAGLARKGVMFLLVREKHLPAATQAALARRIVEAVAPATSTQVLVPGRVDIALAAGAHGIHLSSAPGELVPAQIRRIFPEATVSVSCHTLDEVRRARDHQASLALFAPVFGKFVDGVEVTPAAGLDALRVACQAASPMPVFALGGVTSANASHCLAAGAAGVAGIRMFFPSFQRGMTRVR